MARARASAARLASNKRRRSTLLTLASAMGLRGGCVAGVVVNRTRSEHVSADDLHRGEGNAVLVSAEARMEGEALRLTASDVEALDTAASGAGGGVRLWLDDVSGLKDIQSLLAREGRGRGRVVLVPRTGPGQEVEVALRETYNIGPRMMQAMKAMPGVSAMEEI